MNLTTRSFPVRFAFLFLAAGLVACGSSGNGDSPTGVSAADTAAMPADTNKAPGSSAALPEAVSIADAIKDMAASSGIYIGEIPEGFPVDFMPLYPGGEIDKSSVKEDAVTLLQLAPADKETVFAWYKDFYRGIGWSDSKPVTVAGRTLTGFKGKNGRVDMTLIDREEGKTFVALALSPD